MIGPVDVTWGSHLWTIAGNDGRVCQVIAKTGTPYEQALLEDIAGRISGGLAIDVGAHVGNHALALAIGCGLSVAAFEPDPDAYGHLIANLDRNRATTVTPYNVGLSDQPGQATPGPRGTLDTAGGPIPVITLDSLDLDDVTVIKIDVEGMESRVLAGAAGTLARCRPYVYVEAWTDADRAAIAEALRPLGYRHAVTIGRPGWAPNERWEP